MEFLDSLEFVCIIVARSFRAAIIFL